jgi:hypothetical protein
MTLRSSYPEWMEDIYKAIEVAKALGQKVLQVDVSNDHDTGTGYYKCAGLYENKLISMGYKTNSDLRTLKIEWE